jgi:hypothetical protein
MSVVTRYADNVNTFIKSELRRSELTCHRIVTANVQVASDVKFI